MRRTVFSLLMLPLALSSNAEKNEPENTGI